MLFSLCYPLLICFKLTTYRNIGIVLMVIGGILLILGIIFAIKSGRRGKSIPPVGSYYNSAAAPQTV